LFGCFQGLPPLDASPPGDAKIIEQHKISLALPVFLQSTTLTRVHLGNHFVVCLKSLCEQVLRTKIKTSM